MARLSAGVELMLWSVAALCLCAVVFAAVSAQRARANAQTIVRSSEPVQMLVGAPVESSASREGDIAPSLPPVRKRSAGEVIGRLEIPALGVVVPMTEGIETASLIKGVGHIEGTAMPGGLGTLGLAGHRDTYLRPLQQVAIGMDIRILDATGAYHYVVDSTEIVSPEDVDVLSIRSRPELTLITCYPFYFVGSAPKRFIVHAHLRSAEPDSTTSRTHAQK